MVLTFDPFREFDRLAAHMTGTPAQAMPIFCAMMFFGEPISLIMWSTASLAPPCSGP